MFKVYTLGITLSIGLIKKVYNIIMNNNSLKLNEDTKAFIMEISALSGIPQNVVKEVLEYMIIDWSIKISDHPEEFVDLTVPYIGNIGVKYEGDSVTPEGDLETLVSSYVNLSSPFKKLIGDLHDEARTELVDMLQRKIDQAVLVASAAD